MGTPERLGFGFQERTNVMSLTIEIALGAAVALDIKEAPA